MPHDPDTEYRCPKCGASAALLIPEPALRDTHVALKCVECAHISRIPRSQLEGAGPLDTNRSID
jgi:DNA-directed RNA polymerase subunit RPC12/RpoP